MIALLQDYISKALLDFSVPDQLTQHDYAPMYELNFEPDSDQPPRVAV